jgi:hypothetical protein
VHYLMETINLHGLNRDEAQERMEKGLQNALQNGASVVRIIHGQGKHSEVFPVLKSQARHWLKESSFAMRYIKHVFRGEDGSPFTTPNPGETIVELNIQGAVTFNKTEQLDFDEEEEREGRRNAKRLRADRLRIARRRR